jgi:hypothetical protein
MKNGRIGIVRYLMEVDGFDFIHRFFQVLFRKEHFISSNITIKIIFIIVSCFVASILWPLSTLNFWPLQHSTTVQYVPDFDVVRE